MPLRRYTRIVSTNLVTDRLLLELAEPDRILAFSRAAAERPQDGYRYAGKLVVDGFGPVEALIALRPDLVLTNSFGTPGRSAKLRSAGIEVFDLGELRGVSSLVSAAKTLAELLGQPERGQNFARSFRPADEQRGSRGWQGGRARPPCFCRSSATRFKAAPPARRCTTF